MNVVFDVEVVEVVTVVMFFGIILVVGIIFNGFQVINDIVLKGN